MRAKQYQPGDSIGTATVAAVRKPGKRKVLDLVRRDGEYRVFCKSLWATEARTSEHPMLSHEFTSQLEVVYPSFLIARGDSERVEVLRSPVVRGGPMYEPVSRFIAEHGLVLAVQETFDDPDWLDARVEMSVYVAAAE